MSNTTSVQLVDARLLVEILVNTKPQQILTIITTPPQIQVASNTTPPTPLSGSFYDGSANNQDYISALWSSNICDSDGIYGLPVTSNLPMVVIAAEGVQLGAY